VDGEVALRWRHIGGHGPSALACLSAIGERTYSLNQLDEALADAEAMRITKALVDPWASA
jgi:hypothetical protein